MRSVISWLAVALLVSLATAEESATKPAAQPEAESTPVEKDDVAVNLVLKHASFSADEQPEFVVRFKNVGKDYINLYDVAAYWNWKIDLVDADRPAPQGGPWRLRMNAIAERHHIDHRQIKPGQSTDVLVNLNDPPFTFSYDYEGPLAGTKIRPIRSLSPGHYRLIATIALSNPFGDGYHEWSGPVTTEPVKLTITESTPKPETKEELAAYDTAISRVTDNLGSGGLWMNGHFPKIDLPGDAKTDDVIDAAVNQASLDSKAYNVLRVQPFKKDEMPGSVSGSAALLRVGKAYKVVIVFPFEKSGWWSRFYDTNVELPKNASPTTGASR
jgi:hypothetical protein